MRFALMAGVLIAGLAAGGCGGSTPKPEPKPTPGPARERGRSEGLVNVRTITYRSSFDHTDVTGLAAIPRGVRSRGCVIWQNGFRSTKEESAFAWQPLATLGLATFSIDFRFHGARGGPEDLQQVLERRSKFAAMVRGTVGDLRSAVGRLEKEPWCAHNVAYVGISLGGAVGTILAADDRRIRAVALLVTPGAWRGVPTVPKGVSAFDPDRYVGRIAPRPVLILNGRQDTTVVLRNARKLQAAARRPKTVIDVDAGHNLKVGAGPDETEITNAVTSFLLRTVVEPTYGIHGKSDGTFFLKR